MLIPGLSEALGRGRAAVWQTTSCHEYPRLSGHGPVAPEGCRTHNAGTVREAPSQSLRVEACSLVDHVVARNEVFLEAVHHDAKFLCFVWGELKCAEDVLSLVPHDVEQGIYLVFFRLRA